MTLTDLYTALKGLTGFENKIVYHAWPVGESPGLPFIVYLVDGSDNFGADNKVYKAINKINIELYSKNKDTTSEGLIESMLDSHSIYWEKDETYLDDEQCFEIIYSIEV